MASSDRPSEGRLMDEFDGKQAELIEKLSEISTSMRQCADIVESFTRIVRQFSFRPTVVEAPTLRQPPELGPSRGSGSAPPERSRPPSTHIESVGSPSYVQGVEGHRRPPQYGSGTMLPPAVPPSHPAGLPAPHPSSTPMPGPPSYPIHRPSSATSGAGPSGSHEAGGHRAVDVMTSASERRESPTKHGKRKRPHHTEPGEFGDESDVDTGAEGSSRPETRGGTSETEQATHRLARHHAESMERSLGARVFSPKGRAVTEVTRAGDRPSELPSGPSIVVFSSGAGSSRSRALQSRPTQASSSRSRKEKKPKDPNAPKQPPPAYIVYQNEIRESMRARFPTHSPTELVKEIAATWKTLSNEERQRYKDYASVEKDRWVAELAAYQASLSTPDESQTGKASEGSFLATGISDSPPVSSPRQSPSQSETEGDTYKPRRVASHDTPGGSTPFAYHVPVRAAATFSGTGTAGTAGLPTGGESRSGRTSSQGYSGYAQGEPMRPERSLSRLGFTPSSAYGHLSMPSPPAGLSHYPGHMELRHSSTRLPSFESLGLPVQPTPREPSPGPMRERSGPEGEPVSKRQRTRTNPPSEEEEDGGSSRPAHEGRESE